ncbi:hypothetical protein GTS_39000 [Gandjariella thermophila]|uniref:Uncharacterized protein n=1 Tax=Gandjariella thermophila TaxID=1931992 RepID=A0A4D4JED1_9PSEU|nr:hypothetical protein GTS_39000 [Gandjariella thermophila]
MPFGCCDPLPDRSSGVTAHRRPTGVRIATFPAGNRAICLWDRVRTGHYGMDSSRTAHLAPAWAPATLGVWLAVIARDAHVPPTGPALPHDRAP